MDKSIILDLPSSPGVYFFKDENEHIIYIGKAKNIKKRVQSHFSSKKQTLPFHAHITSVDVIPTRTEKRALILENDLIKKHQPRYNIELKDDKNYTFVSFSKGEFPSISLTHQPKEKGKEYIGPFISSREIKHYLTTIRKLFPYKTCTNKYEKKCLYADMNLCAAHPPYTSKEYKTLMQGLQSLLLLFAGKRVSLEGYDISHTQGSYTVGAMVRFTSKTPKKDMYRKFNIKDISHNDPQALKQIISRRLSHDEWPLPSLILVDGGKAQLSHLHNLTLPIIALAKGEGRDMRTGTLYSLYGSTPLSSLPSSVSQTLLRIRDEAHRFAITHQRVHHRKTLL